MNDIQNSTSFERLKGILKTRYGRGIELNFLVNTENANSDSNSTRLKEGSLLIPIHSHGHFLGMAKIPDAQTLPETSQSAITEIVRLILEPALYNAFLNRSEDNASAGTHHVGLHIVDATLQTSLDQDRSPIVLITSSNPHRVPRVAQQAHEAMNRWAFVNWKDIRSQIRTSKDLRDLGAMSIFIDDVLTLTPDEKQTLDTWFASSQSDSQPALIVGTTMTWQELKEQEILPSLLLHDAGFRQIQADRLPADRRFCEEAIKLLLDKEADLQS